MSGGLGQRAYVVAQAHFARWLRQAQEGKRGHLVVVVVVVAIDLAGDWHWFAGLLSRVVVVAGRLLILVGVHLFVLGIVAVEKDRWTGPNSKAWKVPVSVHIPARANDAPCQCCDFS